MNLSRIGTNSGLMNIPDQKFLFGHIATTENAITKETGTKPAYAVSISREGLEKLNKNKGTLTMGVEKADQYKAILSKSQIDVTGTIEAEFHHRYTMLNSEGKRNKNGDLNAEEFTRNALSAYVEMYDEIKRGYADGSREIYIADANAEFGYRRATEEEEIAALDAAFDFHASYTEGYMRFLREDKDAMMSGIQRTQDLWAAAREKRDADVARQTEQEHMEKLLERVQGENDKPVVNLAELWKESRGLIKMQYGQLGNNIAGLLDSVYKNRQGKI